MTSKLYPHLIKDTEITIYVRKVSPKLVKEAYDLFSEPEPPMNTVTYADGQEKQEPNPADPNYEKQLREHKTKVAMAINDLLIDRGVVIELSEDQLQEVKELREYWKQKYKKNLEGSDKYIYINDIAIGTQEDLQDLIKDITRRSGATPEGTAQALDSFRSEV